MKDGRLLAQSTDILPDMGMQRIVKEEFHDLLKGIFSKDKVEDIFRDIGRLRKDKDDGSNF